MNSLLDKKVTLKVSDVLFIFIILYFIHHILKEVGGIHMIINDIIKACVYL